MGKSAALGLAFALVSVGLIGVKLDAAGHGGVSHVGGGSHGGIHAGGGSLVVVNGGGSGGVRTGIHNRFLVPFVIDCTIATTRRAITLKSRRVPIARR